MCLLLEENRSDQLELCNIKFQLLKLEKPDIMMFYTYWRYHYEEITRIQGLVTFLGILKGNSMQKMTDWLTDWRCWFHKDSRRVLKKNFINTTKNIPCDVYAQPPQTIRNSIDLFFVSQNNRHDSGSIRSRVLTDGFKDRKDHEFWESIFLGVSSGFITFPLILSYQGNNFQIHLL